MLDVDTASKTGANPLYERLGFRATQRQQALVRHFWRTRQAQRRSISRRLVRMTPSLRNVGITNGPGSSLYPARERAALVWAHPRCSWERRGTWGSRRVCRAPQRSASGSAHGRCRHAGGGIRRASRAVRALAGARPPNWVGTPRARRRAGLSIYSILLIMLLSVSVLSSIVVGIIGYINGTEALRAIAYEKLVEIRENRAREVTQLFSTIENAVRLGRDERDQQAGGRRLHRGLRRAGSAAGWMPRHPPRSPSTIATRSPPTCRRRPARTSTERPSRRRTPAAQYLQANYVIPYDSWEEAILTDDAGDGSAWSAAHAKYHDYFRAMTQLQDFEDVLMIDTQGNVVYSAFKGVDLGTNLLDGPYRLSNLVGGVPRVDEPQHRRRGRARRLRRVQPEPGQSRRLGGDPDRRRRHRRSGRSRSSCRSTGSTRS